jgi:RsiW-degrading membrane proteinase PrsW (M82 family)
MHTLIAIAASALPTTLYALLIWWLDRYEKEPLALLLVVFAWGALPAIGIALLFELALTGVAAASPLGPGVARWGLAPLVEEPVKALALVGLFVFARGDFDGPLDGIVYGALVGFGFAMTENLFYFLLEDPSLLSGRIWSRAILFGGTHALFTAVVGVALGAVRYARRRWLGYAVLPAALLVAVLLHALHNFLVAGPRPGLLLAAAWLAQGSGLLVLLAVAVLAWRHERAWIERELHDEVLSGTISPEDYDEARLLRRRLRAQLHPLLGGDWSRWRLRWRLHQDMTRLAFCKHQLNLQDRFRTCDDRDRLRRSILATRARLARADAATV